MREYSGHIKASQEVMRQQAAIPQNVGTKMVRTGSFAYIRMFTTLFDTNMEKKNKNQSLN